MPSGLSSSLETCPLRPTSSTSPRSGRLDKLWLLGGYLKPLTYKLGSQCGPRKPWEHLWVVDGCAGVGAYKELDAVGRVQDGSPLVAAKWAEQERIRQRYPVVRCINVDGPGVLRRA